MSKLTEEEKFLDRIHFLFVRKSQKEKYKKTANELVETLSKLKDLLICTVDGIEIAAYAKNRLESEEAIEELLRRYEAQKERIKELESELELIKKTPPKST